MYEKTIALLKLVLFIIATLALAFTIIEKESNIINASCLLFDNYEVKTEE